MERAERSGRSGRGGRPAERWGRAVLASGIVQAAADLLAGACCPGCGAPGLGVCPACRHQLVRHEAGPTRPTPCPDGFPPTWTAGPYDPVTQAMIVALKERGAGWLTGLLSEQLVAPLSLALGPPARGTAWLVPVPSSPRTVRERGLDVTLTLARRAARRLRASGRQIEVRAVLRQQRRPADQAGLTMEERFANLRGALRARGRVAADVRVVVVDDVVTTGASLTEAARALRVAGAADVTAAVVAATVRRTAPAGPT